MVAPMESSSVERHDFRDDEDREWRRRRNRDDYEREWGHPGPPEYHDDWRHRPHHWPRAYWGPSVLDLAIDNTLHLGAAVLHRAPYLGFRLAELAEAVVLRPLAAWRVEECWPEPYWPRHKKEKCWPEPYWPRHEEECRSEPCWPRHKKEKCWPERCWPGSKYDRSVDLRIDSRLGDTRIKEILVENNSPRPVDINLHADPWVDASGGSVGDKITLAPASFHLEPRASQPFTATIDVSSPFVPGISYFTSIHLEGSSARPVSVELSVTPQDRVDVLALTDPCRPRRGRFVEFCEEPRKWPRHRRFDPCFPWREPWGPWYWRSYDQHYFWDRPGRLFWLAAR
jgi:hypothetical protein